MNDSKIGGTDRNRIDPYQDFSACRDGRRSGFTPVLGLAFDGDGEAWMRDCPGTPREIYFTPKNRFVAEFIGAENIVVSAIENGHLVLPGGRQPIDCNANMATAVAMIRPETIRMVEVGSASLSGIIDTVSFVGHRQRLVVSGASNKLLKVEAPNTVQARAGERIGLSISPFAVRLLPLEN